MLVAMQVKAKQPWLQWLTLHNSWTKFCHLALRNFVQNDLYWAVQHFLHKAHGSFGLAVVSELDAGCLVLAALRQPMTIAVVPQSG